MGIPEVMFTSMWFGSGVSLTYLIFDLGGLSSIFKFFTIFSIVVGIASYFFWVWLGYRDLNRFTWLGILITGWLGLAMRWCRISSSHCVSKIIKKNNPYGLFFSLGAWPFRPNFSSVSTPDYYPDFSLGAPSSGVVDSVGFVG